MIIFAAAFATRFARISREPHGLGPVVPQVCQLTKDAGIGPELAFAAVKPGSIPELVKGGVRYKLVGYALPGFSSSRDATKRIAVTSRGEIAKYERTTPFPDVAGNYLVTVSSYDVANWQPWAGEMRTTQVVPIFRDGAGREVTAFYWFKTTEEREAPIPQGESPVETVIKHLDYADANSIARMLIGNERHIGHVSEIPLNMAEQSKNPTTKALCYLLADSQTSLHRLRYFADLPMAEGAIKNPAFWNNPDLFKAIRYSGPGESKYTSFGELGNIGLMPYCQDLVKMEQKVKVPWVQNHLLATAYFWQKIKLNRQESLVVLGQVTNDLRASRDDYENLVPISSLLRWVGLSFPDLQASVRAACGERVWYDSDSDHFSFALKPSIEQVAQAWDKVLKAQSGSLGLSIASK